MKSPDDLRIIAGWLNNLAELTRHGEDGRPSKARTAITATMLGEDFPSTAFTLASLHAVAQGHEWFPAYDVIRQRIGDWWLENKPKSARALPPPERMESGSDLDGLDRMWFDYFRKREAEGFGPPTSTARPSSRARALSLVRQMSPPAYAAIVGSDARDSEPTQAEPWREVISA